MEYVFDMINTIVHITYFTLMGELKRELGTSWELTNFALWYSLWNSFTIQQLTSTPIVYTLEFWTCKQMIDN